MQAVMMLKERRCRFRLLGLSAPLAASESPYRCLSWMHDDLSVAGVARCHLCQATTGAIADTRTCLE